MKYKVSSAFAMCTVMIATFMTNPATALAQIDPVVGNYDSSDQTGIVRLSGHTDYQWYMQVRPGNGRLYLFVNGYPIAGSYYDYGAYRVVVLDQYGAIFVYHVDLGELNTTGPRAIIDFFADDFGNWITPGHNVLHEAI